jgi:malate synthase
MAASTEAAPCYDVPEGVDVRGRYDPAFASVLTRDALAFVASLQREFRGAVRYAMEQRREAQRRYDAGELPRFDPATRSVREGSWRCAPVPPAVADRTVEITGPAEPRKMVINALNSGAKVFMVSKYTRTAVAGVRTDRDVAARFNVFSPCSKTTRTNTYSTRAVALG